MEILRSEDNVKEQEEEEEGEEEEEEEEMEEETREMRWRGNDGASRSDIWSVGVVIFWLALWR